MSTPSSSTSIRLLTPDGVFVLGVPAIEPGRALEGNLENPYHVNNITPPPGSPKVRRFFHKAPRLSPLGRARVDQAGPTVKCGSTTDRGRQFTFSETRRRGHDGRTPHDHHDHRRARNPRPHPLPKTTDEVGYPAEWNVDLAAPGPPRRRRRPHQPASARSSRRSSPRRTGIDPGRGHDGDLRPRVNNCDLDVSLRTRSRAHGPLVARARSTRPRSPWSTTTGSARVPTRVANARGRRFALVLRSPEADSDHAVTAYYTSADVPGREMLKVGRLEPPGNVLHMHTYGAK